MARSCPDIRDGVSLCTLAALYKLFMNNLSYYLHLVTAPHKMTLRYSEILLTLPLIR